MKQVLSLTLSLLVAITVGQGQTVGRKSDRTKKIEQQLRELEKLRSQAIKQGDMSALNEIYADDFSGIVGSGQIINKAELLEVFKRTDPRLIFNTDEIKLRVFGSTAIFTGRLTGKTAEGEIIFASRFTHVFVKRGARWQCVAGQSTAIAK
jgi:ketosteroid isomerase-like protein